MTAEPTARPRVIRFGTFEVDLSARELRKSGIRIKLHGQPFEVLAILLDRPGETVPREELRQKLWPTDTFVDFDHGVNTAINRLREALGDSAENPRFVETVPRRGYRFIAPVETQASVGPKSSITPDGPASPEPSPAEALVVPPARGSRAKVLALVLTAAVALLVALSLSSVRERLLGRRSLPHIQSLAVLPLVNLSGDVEQDYFADGMTEALTTDLGKVSALRVISRTSAMRYRRTKKSLQEIAQELRVDAVVEGTVARSGGHVRITANLIQVSPEKHVWAESYEGEVGDILTVQGEVAQAVAHEIQVKLTPQEQKLLAGARPVNPEAHDAYLKGRYFWHKGTPDGLDKAIRYFQEAIGKDPSYPLAYSGLADCYVEWVPGRPSPKELMPKAKDAAVKALQLDENLAEAHNSLAGVELLYDWNWSAAEREFKRAIELNPNYSTAHEWYAHYLVAMGRLDESIAEATRSLELDPFSPTTNDYAAWLFYLARHYDLAIQQSRKMLELDPNFAWGHYTLGLAYEQTGRSGEAVQEFLKADELFGASPDRVTELKEVYRVSGVRGYWQKELAFAQENSKHFYFSNMRVASICVRLGEVNDAFEWLEKGYAEREVLLTYLKVDPYWDDIRSDPRFRDLVRRVGLPQ